MKSSAPKIQVAACEASINEAHTRMPFRYGNACLTKAPILHVSVQIEGPGGEQALGMAADCLPPLWFDKDTSKNYRRNVDDQLTAFRQAREIYLLLGRTGQTVYELWQAAFPRVIDEAHAAGINALTASFGSSFLERAVIDAVCRLRGVSFFDALRKDVLGLKTSKIVPPKPETSLWCRHTIGLGDPITVGEIPPDERLNDNLPQALEEDIEFYGLRYFKIKISGEHDHDLERLTRMAALFSQRCSNGYHVTIDGNEQYRDLEQLEKLLEDLKSRPYGQEFFDSVLFVEQPLHRDIALKERAAKGVKRLSEMKAVIIDESDDRLDSFQQSVELGYQGVSHKNCKGVFKSLLNRDRIQKLNAECGEEKYFQSGEDLANVAVVPVQEDFAALAALGITHCERNGHHYYHGLDYLPSKEAESALAIHSDLYEEREGSVFLRVVDGSVEIGSVVDALGFGYASEIDFAGRIPIDSWSFDAFEAGDRP